MGEAYIDILKAFNFKEMHVWIATVSAVLFLFSLLGGMISALFFVNSNALRPRPLKERISFRMLIMGEVLLLTFVFFYHVFMIERMSLSHIIYWAAAMVIMPLLAFIGSQLMLVSYSGRMKAKDDAWKAKRRAIRAKRTEGIDKHPAKAGTKLGGKPAHKGH